MIAISQSKGGREEVRHGDGTRRTIWSTGEPALDVLDEEVAKSGADLGLGFGEDEVGVVVGVALRDAYEYERSREIVSVQPNRRSSDHRHSSD